MLSDSTHTQQSARASMPATCLDSFTLDMHAAITAMDHSPAAQLAAGACLAQLCAVEAQDRAREPDCRLGHSCLDSAVADGTFALVTSCISACVTWPGPQLMRHMVPQL